MTTSTGATATTGLTALVVEDEAVVAESNALYLQRLGLEVVGVARSGRDALRLLAANPDIDLVVLDMNLPDSHGLDLLRRIRGAGHGADVIAVTAARDVEVVRQAVAQGVVAYVIKPFTFGSFRTKIEQYLAYRVQLDSRQAALAQSDVDAMIATLRPALSSQDLPKGLSVEMLGRITAVLQGADAERGRGGRRDRYLEGDGASVPGYLADAALADDGRRTKVVPADRRCAIGGAEPPASGPGSGSEFRRAATRPEGGCSRAALFLYSRRVHRRDDLVRGDEPGEEAARHHRGCRAQGRGQQGHGVTGSARDGRGRRRDPPADFGGGDRVGLLGFGVARRWPRGRPARSASCCPASVRGTSARSPRGPAKCSATQDFGSS